MEIMMKRIITDMIRPAVGESSAPWEVDYVCAKIKCRCGRTQTVGTATLRMADVPEVVRLLSERLRFENLLLAAESAARKSKRLKARKRWVHCL
jgi:hypothetical protein